MDAPLSGHRQGVTSGSGEAIQECDGRRFLDPGDEVLVDTPAYVGALQAFRFFRARVTFLPCDQDGVDPDALRCALGRRPKLVYLTPTFQNPSGLCHTERRRLDVAHVLRESSAVLLEDDPYREIWFEAPPPPPIRLVEGAARLARAVESWSRWWLSARQAAPAARLSGGLRPP